MKQTSQLVSARLDIDVKQLIWGLQDVQYDITTFKVGAQCIDYKILDIIFVNRIAFCFFYVRSWPVPEELNRIAALAA